MLILDFDRFFLVKINTLSNVLPHFGQIPQVLMPSLIFLSAGGAGGGGGFIAPFGGIGFDPFFIYPPKIKEFR